VVPHTQGIALQVYRELHNFGTPFFGADGTNAWDTNDPRLYASGTLTGATSTTLTHSSKRWTVNQWRGFNVRRPSDRTVAVIISNTSNTLTIGDWASPGWASGNAYEIRKVLRIIDQPGLGAGDHINRASPAWPHQVSEPCYSWNNTNSDDGSSFGFTQATGGTTILAGRDYFNNTPMPGYVPYTYPHPLVSNASPTPSP
jgi:hypothetical protein